MAITLLLSYSESAPLSRVRDVPAVLKERLSVGILSCKPLSATILTIWIVSYRLYLFFVER